MRQSSFQNVKAFLKLRVADNQRNENTHHVAIGASGNGDQAILITILRELFCFVGSGFARCRIFNQLNGAHSTEAANFANHLKLFFPFLAALFKFPAQRGGTREQPVFFDDLERCKRCRAGCGS